MSDKKLWFINLRKFIFKSFKMTNISAPEHEPLPQNCLSDIPSRQIDSNSSARYWTFLVDNLKRSIEQIYQTCESDQNPMQCQVSLVFF